MRRSFAIKFGVIFEALKFWSFSRQTARSGHLLANANDALAP
jgi:hypothetical protein